MNLAMLFITHDMRVAAQVCHRVMVMRHGKIVEHVLRATFCGAVQRLHQALLAAIPGRRGKAPPISSDALRDDARH